MENYLISSFSEMYGFTNQSLINLQMIPELIILKNAINNSKTLGRSLTGYFIRADNIFYPAV